MSTLLYIHGRGLKPPANQERAAWLEALNRGLQRLSPVPPAVADDDQFRLAYWSDRFYPTTSPTAAADGGLSAAQQLVVQAMARKFWAWRLPDGPPPASTTEQFEDNFVRDVVKFFGLGFAQTCGQPLRDELIASDGEVMLVSHSFGTVIAYETLITGVAEIDAARARLGRPPLQVDTWATMGTPLSWVIDLQRYVPDWKAQLLLEVDQGLQPVLQRARQALDLLGQLSRGLSGLFDAPAPGGPSVAGAILKVAPKQYPPRGVARWYNIFDSRDPVACAGGVASMLGDLAVGPTFLYQGHQRAFDVQVRNDACPADVRLADERAHEDYAGYGQCAQLAQLVADFRQRQGP